MNHFNWRHLTIGILLTPLVAFSQAPVVDDSENFALLENQQVSTGSPAKGAPIVYGENERPLAHDNTPSGNDGMNNARLIDKIQGLQQELQELRGQLEIQGHEIKTLKEQQLSFYKDLDDRLRAKTSATAPVPTAPPAQAPAEKVAQTTPQDEPITVVPPSANLHNPADEQVAYLAAYELIQTKQFDKAQQSMQRFVDQYPNGGYAANAHYWLGELYLAKGTPKEAIPHFEKVIKQFSSSSKVAPSMLKLGYAYAANGQIPEARTQLQTVLKSYPDTETAKLASKKLNTLPRS